MTKEIRSYIKAEAIVAAAFNFFINGMIAALIHHKADTVAMDVISIAIDLTLTCLSIVILTALFSRASVRRTKTAGILESKSRLIRFSGGLYQRPVLFGALIGFITAAVLFTLTAPVFALLEIYALPFGVYVALKCIFAALLGGGAVALELYAGMCKKK